MPNAGKDRGQEKRASEDEMAGRHHQCNEQELGQALGRGAGQGGLVCWAVWTVLQSTGWRRVGRDWVTDQQEQITH